LPIRTWRNNPLIGAVLVCIVMGAAWLAYRSLQAPRESVKYSYVLKCTNCGEVFEDSYPKGKKPPFPCKKCGKQAYPALECRACRRVFPSVDGRPSRPPYGCPYCQSRSVFPLEPGQTSSNAESPEL
jgi:rRNA maturation endonuclease Nob1